jgi:putative endopeptidase
MMSRLSETKNVLILIFALSSTVIAQNSNRFDSARIDRTCKPCEDFYQFVNGNWLKDNPIPAAFGKWGTFDILQQENLMVLRQILEQSAANPKPPDTNQRVIGTFYSSCMDEKRIESLGANPIAADLSKIDQINKVPSLLLEAARLHESGVPAIFEFEARQDFRDSSQNIASLRPARLSLPNKDYYTKTDEKAENTRADFVNYASRIFELLGESPQQASKDAQTVLRTETQLAEISMSVVELRDPSAQDNKRSMAALRTLVPELLWNDYLSTRKIKQPREINVTQLKYFDGLNKLVKSIPLPDWKVYMRWQVVNDAAPHLSSKFVDENFHFYGQVLSGATELQPRWRRCVRATDALVGDALGKVYVASEFPPESKARMERMINNLVAAFRERIQSRQWMSDVTKGAALEKLEAFARKIGYPVKWKDYSRLRLVPDDYFGNTRRAAALEEQRNVQKIEKPVDRTEWAMTTPTVNAYYSGFNNEIVFPAGILRPPFFDADADDALNYGAIGSVIGHELTHGFDDQGGKFDAKGNLRTWWTAADQGQFLSRAECVTEQFSGYKSTDGTHLNGKLVLGESIADLGGVTIAYQAFLKSMEGKPRPISIDGFTPEQRFFIGWAIVWSSNQRVESERQQVLGDPHPLSRFRANGPLANLPEFAAAFGCTADNPMTRPTAQQCEVW